MRKLTLSALIVIASSSAVASAAARLDASHAPAKGLARSRGMVVPSLVEPSHVLLPLFLSTMLAATL